MRIFIKRENASKKKRTALMNHLAWCSYFKVHRSSNFLASSSPSNMATMDLALLLIGILFVYVYFLWIFSRKDIRSLIVDRSDSVFVVRMISRNDIDNKKGKREGLMH